jgi:hypothetical protein
MNNFIEELQRSTTETRRASKKVLRENAMTIMKTSQDGAPVDEGNLEAAHKIETVRLSRDNIELEITVGGEHGDRDVDEYAWKMHDTSYQLGEKSIQKAGFSPEMVGPRFLDRAFSKHQADLIREVTDTLPGD